MQLIPREELLNLHLNKVGPVPMEIYRYLTDYYLIKVGYAELETVQYINNDWNDLMQISSTSRMSLVDFITLILGSLGVISGEFHDETRWTITLQQPTAVQVEAASGSVCSG
jgi:hypothetical protein